MTSPQCTRIAGECSALGHPGELGAGGGGGKDADTRVSLTISTCTDCHVQRCRGLFAPLISVNTIIVAGRVATMLTTLHLPGLRV